MTTSSHPLFFPLITAKVPEHRYFVLGDHRSVSVDSRTKDIGTVSQDQIVGKAMLIVWPLTNFGGVH